MAAAKDKNPLDQFGSNAFQNQQSIDPTQAAPRAQDVSSGAFKDPYGNTTATPMTPDQMNQELARQAASEALGPNKGLGPDGKPVQVIDITKGPFGQQMQKVNLPSAEQQAALEKTKQDQARLQQQMQTAPIAEQVGQNIRPNNEIQLQKGGVSNILSAAGEGLAQGVQGAAIGAGTGAAAGALGAPITAGLSVPAVAAIGAATGFIGGFVKGAYSNLNQDYEKSITALDTRYTGALNQMSLIIKDVNSGADPQKAQIVFNDKLAEIDAIDREMKEASTGIWNDKTKKTQQKIIEFNSYQRSKMIGDLQNAILNPDKTRVIDYPSNLDLSGSGQ